MSKEKTVGVNTSNGKVRTQVVLTDNGTTETHHRIGPGDFHGILVLDKDIEGEVQHRQADAPQEGIHNLLGCGG